MDFSVSRRQISITVILVFVLLLAVLVITIFLHRDSEISLITLLPDQPVGYLSVKELGSFVDAFQNSDFGKVARQIPIVDNIQQKVMVSLKNQVPLYYEEIEVLPYNLS